jgi:hypothetical protein
VRYELTEYEWTAINPFLPNKPGGVPRVNDRRVLNGIFWVLRSGASWRDLPENFGPLCVPKTSSADEFGASRWSPPGLALFLRIGGLGHSQDLGKDGAKRIVRISACFDRGSPTRLAGLSEPP